MANEAKYKRVVLKLSGEALAGEKGYGIDPNVVIPSPDKSRKYWTAVWKLL